MGTAEHFGDRLVRQLVQPEFPDLAALCRFHGGSSPGQIGLCSQTPKGGAGCKRSADGRQPNSIH